MVVAEVRCLVRKGWNDRTVVASMGETADTAAREFTGCLKSSGTGKGKNRFLRGEKIRT